MSIPQFSRFCPLYLLEDIYTSVCGCAHTNPGNTLWFGSVRNSGCKARVGFTGEYGYEESVPDGVSSLGGFLCLPLYLQCHFHIRTI